MFSHLKSEIEQSCVKHSLLAVICVLSLWKPIAAYVSNRNATDISNSLFHYGIIPDLLRMPPLHTIKATYSYGYSPNLGNKIEAQYLKHNPYIILWPFDGKKFYTLILVDLDEPTPKAPTKREWLHYILANIPGPAVSQGEILAPYVPPNPREGTHRLVYLVFMHPQGRVEFREKKLESTCAKSRNPSSEVQPPPTVKDTASIRAAFKKHELIPDILAKAPNQTLQVAFYSDNYVDLGNYLVPSLWDQRPNKISFEAAHKNRMYVLIMTELDYPSRKTPLEREWYHWVLGDIPGGNFRKGKTVMAYIGPKMKENSGFHRVAFLLMEQLDGRIIYEEKHLSTTVHMKKRTKHSTQKFMEKYNLTGPVAGNFFLSGYNYPNL